MTGQSKFITKKLRALTHCFRMVSDCPDPCPQNRHCDDTTHGLCECIPGHESDPNDPTGACCPGETFLFYSCAI